MSILLLHVAIYALMLKAQVTVDSHCCCSIYHEHFYRSPWGLLKY